MWTTWAAGKGGVNHSGRKHSVSTPLRMVTVANFLNLNACNGGAAKRHPVTRHRLRCTSSLVEHELILVRDAGTRKSVGNRLMVPHWRLFAEFSDENVTLGFVVFVGDAVVGGGPAGVAKILPKR